MNEKKSNPGLTWGLITGLLLILAHLGFYLSGGNGQFGFAYTLVSVLIIVAGIVTAVLLTRQGQGGYADTRTLLRQAAMALVIALLLQVAYLYLYYNVIDTAAAVKEKQSVLDAYNKMVPMMGSSPADIAKDRKEIAQLDFTMTPGQALWRLCQYIIRYFVLVFLAAFIFRRKAPVTPNN